MSDFGLLLATAICLFSTDHWIGGIAAIIFIFIGNIGR